MREQIPRKIIKKKGIGFLVDKGRWRLIFYRNGKKINIGYFSNEKDAVIAKERLEILSGELGEVSVAELKRAYFALRIKELSMPKPLTRQENR